MAPLTTGPAWIGGGGGSRDCGILYKGNIDELASLFGVIRASQVPKEFRNARTLSLSFRHEYSRPIPRKMPRSVQMGM